MKHMEFMNLRRREDYGKESDRSLSFYNLFFLISVYKFEKNT